MSKEGGGSTQQGVGMTFTIVIILAWYGSNILVLLLNKFLLTNTGFKQPVFLTLCHMVACVVVGGIVAVSGLMPAKPIKSRAMAGKICLLASIFCLTIVMGNASLRFIPVSFTQAIGATTPFFTAITAFVLQAHRETALTYSTLVPIALGVAIASGGEPLFNMLGFMLALMATAGRALKSVVQAMLMSDPAERLDPMTLLLYMSCASVLMLAPAVLVLEPSAFGMACKMAAANHGFVWWLIFNSLLAYLVNLTNFLVTKYTSALTLQVLGNAKGVVAAIVSVLVFTNPVTWQGAIGYAITILGVFLYSESKRWAKAEKLAAGGHPKSPEPVDSASQPLLDEGWRSGGTSQASKADFRGARDPQADSRV